MLWIQGWITNSIVLPLVKQARNRIKNIKVVKEANGKYNFYNGENVATEIPTTKVVKNSNGTTTLTTGDEDIVVQSSNIALIPCKRATWSTIASINAEEDMLGTSFRLTVVGTYGSYVLAQKIDIVCHHSGVVDVVMVHDKHYGSFKLKIYSDISGNSHIYFMPLSGSTNDEKDFKFVITDFVGESFELAPTSLDAGYTVAYDEVSTNMGYQTKLEKTIVDSKQSEGCINPNPWFNLEDLDYRGYAVTGNRQIVHDNVDVSSGALRVKGSGATLIGEHYLSIPPNRQYRASSSVKSVISGQPSATQQKVKYYLGVTCYDSDYNLILPHHLPMSGRGFGVLTKELKSGDTSITFTGDMTTLTNSTVGHQRSFLLYTLQDGKFRYRGANGRLYQEMAYTRFAFYNYYDENAIVDNGDGTITVTFRSPYQGSYGTIPVGSRIAPTRSGGSYNYWISGRMEDIDNEFHRYSSPWRTLTGDEDASYYSGITRNGGAYVKLLMLPNYSVHDKDGKFENYGYHVAGLECWYGTLALEWRTKR